ncbi:MFS general substrate transporter [Mytilinidion resinicola]|uniref:MFS general substrate transporter n=1 Tax=Mytilinidion resinicola TaxID=574789 RepID=A0A6A6Y211_9PEZI|nr:MFS general substrate transporter [Mytilinidion resinicola]KAF2802679.1 MFS general substrate transporter [Mytilinidion resinicola]
MSTGTRTIQRPPSPSAVVAVPEPAPVLTTSRKRRVAIAVFVLLANLVQMISNGATVAGGFQIGRDLGVRDVRLSNWVAASYPLTQGSFVLVSGRLGSVYGHKKILLFGGAWFSAWSLLNIACRSFLSFNIARGFTGMGGALILPNAVAMIGITFPPGRSRNFCLGIFGAAAPIGGYLGAVLAGIFTRFTPWWGLFLFLGLLAFVVFTVLWKLLPPEKPVDADGKIDWIGAALGTAGLILFNFTWNQAPAAGWSNPYQIGILVGSISTLALFAAWELRSSAPIMPLSIWKAPSFLPLMLSVLMSFMSFGIMLWYMVAWVQLVRSWSTPFLFFGVFAAWWASWLVPRVPVQYILAIGLLSVAISNILIATMPAEQTYWAQVFPATILMSFCPDLVFTAAQIIASNAVGRAQQGVAASLIGVLLLYGNSIGLGFAGTIEMQVDKANKHRVLGYRSALWFGCGIALFALVLDLVFVRMEKDDREGWDDDEDYGEEDRAMASGVELQG